MKRTALAALAVAAALPVLAKDRPSDFTVTPTAPGAVKVCSWNMEWFPSGKPEPKPAKEEAERIDSAARFLKWQNSDIVLLQEMRDAATCSNLVANAALAGFRVNVCSQFRRSTPWTDANQQDAVISRFPTVDAGFMEWNRRKPPASPPRGLTWAVLDVKGELWAFIVVHLKSNRLNAWTDDEKKTEAIVNRQKREESALQLVAWAKENLEGKTYGGRTIKNVFIGGDFNTDQAQKAYKKEKTIPTVTAAGYADTFANVPEAKRQSMPESRHYSAARFDYIFHKGPATISSPEVAPKQYTSDHCMVSVQVKGDAPPTCPNCGGIMDFRTNPKGGQTLWVCAKWPACRGIRQTDK